MRGVKGEGTVPLVLTAITLAVVLRLLPHPANVAPVAGLALFSGAYLERRFAILVPLAAMMVSDAFIGFHELIPFTWGSFLLVGVIGWWVRRRIGFRRIVLGSLFGSVLFYVITNWAVWAFTPLYVKNLSGLAQSYILALPFFRNTMLGDLFYSGAFFGLAALAQRFLSSYAKTTSQNAEE